MRWVTSKRDEHSNLVERSYRLRATYYELTMLILLSITIGSCYSIESDCDNDFSWERTNIPPRITNAVAVTSNGDIWAITSGVSPYNRSTLRLSTDNGDTWVQKTIFPYLYTVLAISPVNGYIFTGSNATILGTPDTEYSLLRSTDNGENWTEVTDKMKINDILITPSGEIYLGVGRNIYYSNDNGDTWIEKGNGLFYNQTVYSLALGQDGTLYACTTDMVCRSTDGGDTWLPSSNHTNIYHNVNIPGIAITDNGSIYAATSRFGNKVGILKSTDRGVTWNPFNNGRPVMDAHKIIYNPITKDIFVDDDQYTSNVYRWSNNLGAWRLKNTGIPDETYICYFAFNPNTGQMYVATAGFDDTKGGLYRTKNYP